VETRLMVCHVPWITWLEIHGGRRGPGGVSICMWGNISTKVPVTFPPMILHTGYWTCDNWKSMINSAIHWLLDYVVLFMSVVESRDKSWSLVLAVCSCDVFDPFINEPLIYTGAQEAKHTLDCVLWEVFVYSHDEARNILCSHYFKWQPHLW